MFITISSRCSRNSLFRILSDIVFYNLVGRCHGDDLNLICILSSAMLMFACFHDRSSGGSIAIKMVQNMFSAIKVCLVSGTAIGMDAFKYLLLVYRLWSVQFWWDILYHRFIPKCRWTALNNQNKGIQLKSQNYFIWSPQWTFKSVAHLFLHRLGLSLWHLVISVDPFIPAHYDPLLCP